MRLRAGSAVLPILLVVAACATLPVAALPDDEDASTPDASSRADSASITDATSSDVTADVLTGDGDADAADALDD